MPRGLKGFEPAYPSAISEASLVLDDLQGVFKRNPASINSLNFHINQHKLVTLYNSNPLHKN